MNTIKWNSTRTGFVLTFQDGTKETYNNKPSSANFVKIEDQRFWLVKN